MKWVDNFKEKIAWGWSGFQGKIVAAKTAAQGALVKSWKFTCENLPVIKNLVATYHKSHDVRTVVSSSVKANLLYYAFPVIVYEGILKPTVFKNSQYGKDIDDLAFKFFGALHICMFVNNTLYNIVLKKTLEPYLPFCEHIDCNCSELEKAKANLASSFHFPGYLLSASLLSAVPQGLTYLAGQELPAVLSYPGYYTKAMAYGFYFIGMKYSFYNVCATHIRKLVNNNLPLSFVTGLSFIYLTDKGVWIVNQLAGTKNNVFIEDAVFSLFLQLYILLALSSQQSLGTETTETDLFYYQRTNVDLVLSKLIEKILNASDKKKPKNYTRMANRALNTRLARWVASTKAISLFLDIYSNDIKAALGALVKARGYPLWVVDYLPKFITPKSARMIANILKQEGWEDIEKLVNVILKIAEKSRDKTETYVKSYSTMEVNESYGTPGANNTQNTTPLSAQKDAKGTRRSALFPPPSVDDDWTEIPDTVESDDDNEDDYHMVSYDKVAAPTVG